MFTGKRRMTLPMMAVLAVTASAARAQYMFINRPIIIPGFSRIGGPGMFVRTIPTMPPIIVNTEPYFGFGGPMLPAQAFMNSSVENVGPTGLLAGEQNAVMGQEETSGTPANDAAGTTTQTAAGGLYGMQPIPRTSDRIEARFEKDNRLLLRWSGEPRAVQRIVFSLQDKNHAPIKEQTVTRLPAEARFTLTNKTAYYRVLVEYVNGTTTDVTSPL